MSSENSRRLAAIMFTDMAGYTALGQRSESLSLALVDEQRKLLRPIFRRHNGREIKTIGDAFLVEFPSALDAARCAYDIQRVTREFNFSIPEDKRFYLRVGVHLGDVTESEHGDISGDAVNVASRIEPLAEQGGVCLTRQVFDQIQNKIDLPLQSLGLKSLKNVSTPLEVYKIVMPWDQGRVETIAHATESETTVNKKRIAVLPFTNMSPDPQDAYFADGITEEIICTISGISDLSVISRTSVMGYKDTTKKLKEIGKELEIGSVLEGSLRRIGNRIRVTAQLIDVANDKHLWAHNYDKTMEDVFAIQTEIATSIASELKIKLVDSDLLRRDTNDIDAYGMFMKASLLLHEDTKSSVSQAIDLLDRAISRDPNFARAYAALSHGWWLSTNVRHGSFAIALAKSEAAARKALELAPNSAEAHGAMANVYSGMDRLKDSIMEAEKAIQINPNFPQAHLTLGMQYLALGEPEKALGPLVRAHELDPLSISTCFGLSFCYQLLGKGREATDVLIRLRDIDPKRAGIYTWLFMLYIEKRDYEKARQTLDIGMKIDPDDLFMRISQGFLHALEGKKEEAESELRMLLGNNDESAQLLAQLLIQTALGNQDGALKALIRMAETHSWPYTITLSSFFEDLRKDPRFKEFARKVGIPESSVR